MQQLSNDKEEINLKQQLEQRLKELRSEFESGQKALAELENRQANLRNTLLRISGAIQLARDSKFDSNDIKHFERLAEPCSKESSAICKTDERK